MLQPSFLSHGWIRRGQVRNHLCATVLKDRYPFGCTRRLFSLLYSRSRSQIRGRCVTRSIRRVFRVVTLLRIVSCCFLKTSAARGKVLPTSDDVVRSISAP